MTAAALYTLAAGLGAGPVATMLVLGVLVLIAAFVVSWNLPPDTRVARALPEASGE